jgi:hypothetical protein
MASYAEAAVNRAVKALIRRDDDLARRKARRTISSTRSNWRSRVTFVAGSRGHGRWGTIDRDGDENFQQPRRVGDGATTISRRVPNSATSPASTSGVRSAAIARPLRF